MAGEYMNPFEAGFKLETEICDEFKELLKEYNLTFTQFRELKSRWDTISGITQTSLIEDDKNKTKFYLFQFDDDTTYEMTCGVSFKDAIWEMAKYKGYGNERLLKALKGFESNDIDGIVDIFECLSYVQIQNVYIVEKKIYNWNKEEE